MAISQWNLVADENGFIVVYPEGTGFGPKSWEMTGIETPPRMPDVTFISDLIDKLAASYNIDKTRIYANGMSNGGGMAFVLSCTMSDRIAAVGMVSAGLDPGWSWCTDHRPVPVIAFHGTILSVCTTAVGRSLPAAHCRVFRALWRIGLGETGADRIRSNPRSLRMSRASNTRTVLTMRAWCWTRSREKAISGLAASG
jgi:pimeloyl-ACP methyl ester carboxylesterase